MRIFYVSSEVVPFAKTGGLADVAGALPPARAASIIHQSADALQTIGELQKAHPESRYLADAQALAALHADHLDEPLVAETLGCLLKDADDIKRFQAEVAKAGLAPFLPATT